MTLGLNVDASAKLDVNALKKRRARGIPPWTTPDVAAWLVGTTVGFGVVIAAWIGSDRASTLSAAVNWLEIGIGGIVVAGATNGVWLLQGRERVGLARVALLHRFGPNDSAASGNEAHRPFVVLPSTARYHRAECPMVRGKDAIAEPTGSYAERVACEVCRP
jgi:hypothetical protein